MIAMPTPRDSQTSTSITSVARWSPCTPQLLGALSRLHVAFLISLSLAACAPKNVAAPPRIVGTLTLIASGDPVPGTARIELPDIDVFLQNSSGAQVGVKSTTQLEGKFRLVAPGPGSYSVCWNATGFGSGCSAKFSVQDQSLFLGAVPMRSQTGVIYGNVLTGDGRACWINDPFFKLDVSTKVTLLDSAQQVVRSGIRANVSGEYAIGGVPPQNRYIVRAECEKASAQTAVSLTGAVAVANVTLPNRAPRIEGMAAVQSGRGLTRGDASAAREPRPPDRRPAVRPPSAPPPNSKVRKAAVIRAIRCCGVRVWRRLTMITPATPRPR